MQYAVLLFAQNYNLTAVTGLQNAAGFSHRLGNRQATGHQLDSGHGHIADDAVAIGSCLVQRDRDLRVEIMYSS